MKDLFKIVAVMLLSLLIASEMRAQTRYVPGSHTATGSGLGPYSLLWGLTTSQTVSNYRLGGPVVYSRSASGVFTHEPDITVNATYNVFSIARNRPGTASISNLMLGNITRTGEYFVYFDHYNGSGARIPRLCTTFPGECRLYFQTTITVNACSVPALTTSNISPCEITIRATNLATDKRVNLRYRETALTAWTTVNNIRFPYQIGNLKPSTSYTIEAQQVCTGAQSSTFARVTATTAALPVPTGLSPGVLASFGVGGSCIPLINTKISVTPINIACTIQYQYQFSTSTNFAGRQIYTYNTPTTPNLNLIAGQSIYYRVRTTLNGANSAWSSTMIFATVPTAMVINAISPTNTEYIIGSNPRFTFSTVQGTGSGSAVRGLYLQISRNNFATFSESGNIGTQRSFNFPLSSAGYYHYRYRGIDACGQNFYSNPMFFVVRPPALSEVIADNSTVCLGGSTTLTAINAMYEVEWYANGGKIGEGAMIQVSPTETTTYRAYHKSNGVLSAAAVEIQIVVENPTIQITAPPSSFCEGTEITLVSEPSIADGQVFWAVNGEEVAEGTTFTSNSLKNSDVVTARLITSSGCEVRSEELVINTTLLEKPVLTASSLFICNGQTITLSVSNLPQDAIISFFKDEVEIQSGTETSLTISEVGIYFAKFKTNCTSEASENIVIEESVLSFVLQQNTTTNVCIGTIQTFTTDLALPAKWFVNDNLVAENVTEFSTNRLFPNDKVKAVVESGSCTASQELTITNVNTPTSFTGVEYIWTGKTADWRETSNWLHKSLTGIPSENENVIIPTCAAIMPNIIANTTAKSKDLLIEDGASVLLHGTLEIAGNLKGSIEAKEIGGTYTGGAGADPEPPSSPIIAFIGSATQSIEGTYSFPNMVINCTDVQITSTSKVEILRTLTMQMGNLTTNDANLILKASQTSQAIIDDFTYAGTNGQIIGELQVEVFPKNASLDWKYFASPVKSMSVMDFATSNQIDLNNIYQFRNELVTGTDINEGWVKADENGVLEPTELYNVQVTGHRAFTFKGLHNSGTFTRTVTAYASPYARFNGVGNPYTAPISSSKLFADNTNADLQKVIFVWKAGAWVGLIDELYPWSVAQGGLVYRLSEGEKNLDFYNHHKIKNLNNNFVSRVEQGTYTKIRLENRQGDADEVLLTEKWDIAKPMDSKRSAFGIFIGKKLNAAKFASRIEEIIDFSILAKEEGNTLSFENLPTNAILVDLQTGKQTEVSSNSQINVKGKGMLHFQLIFKETPESEDILIYTHQNTLYIKAKGVGIVSLHDIIGRELKQVKLTDQAQEISYPDLHGIFIVKYADTKGKQVNKKVYFE